VPSPRVPSSCMIKAYMSPKRVPSKQVLGCANTVCDQGVCFVTSRRVPSRRVPSRRVRVLDAPCATLYTGGCGGWLLFAEGAGDTGGDVLCTILYAGGCVGWTLVSLEVLETPEAMRCVLLLYAGGCGG
jgi:hypothetical protein